MRVLRGLLMAGGLLCLPAMVHAQSGITDRGRNSVTCASDDGRRHYCQVNTNGGVRMTNQRSGSPCVQGQTWGYDRRGVWVDRGCRADFALNGGGGWNGGGGNGGGGNGGGGWNGGGGNGGGNRPGWGGGNGQQVTCSSDDGKRQYCQANTRGGVRMVKQRSGSPCVQGRTWGYDRNAIWVDRGCRADFALR